ncbi:MAG: hypothetical protein MI923_15480 [Phycisphaerales bacterium]|nr:hypothetical protein [Phycisphaerales bacterium]
MRFLLGSGGGGVSVSDSMCASDPGQGGPGLSLFDMDRGIFFDGAIVGG